jgi:hypothetical protein
MKKTVIVVIIALFLLMACDNTGSPDPGSKSVPLAVAYSAAGPDVSKFLERQWAKGNSDFIWTFENDGTVTVIHCCGDKVKRQFSYLFRGNVLITYGSEEFSDEIEAGTFTLTGTVDDFSFTRYNGTSFTKGDEIDSAASSLALSNNLLGTWQGEDGTKYEFGTDAGLAITSPSGDTEQYGYMVRYSVFLSFGPLVDGTEAVLQKYLFNRKGDKLYMSSDGVIYTLNRLE